MNTPPLTSGEVNDPVGGEEEDSLSRKLFERTESLLGRFHTSKKKETTGSSDNLHGRFHNSKQPIRDSREDSPDNLLERLQSSKQKEKPCKRQKTEPSPKMQGIVSAKIQQGMTSPPKMQEMPSPRLKREGSKRKTKVAEDVSDQIFSHNEIGSDADVDFGNDNDDNLNMMMMIIIVTFRCSATMRWAVLFKKRLGSDLLTGSMIK